MRDGRQKSVVQVGSKSLELVDDSEGGRLWFGLVERGVGVRREVWVSEIELLWLCLILEDASSGFQRDFERSYGGFSRRLIVHPIVLVGGFRLRLEVKDRGRFWYVLLPEMCGSGGWVDISRKFWAFCGWKHSDGVVDGRSFKEVAEIGGWRANFVTVKEKGRRHRGCDVDVNVDSTDGIMSFLGRCLVGKLENGALALPSAMEGQRWAQKTWKVTAGVQVSELGGASFLVSLPLVEEAQRILKGCWNFGGRRMELVWWSPVGCRVKQGEEAEEWVRILGLPLQFWGLEVFKGIGDFCGGFYCK